jgi:hypothetical protein
MKESKKKRKKREKKNDKNTYNNELNLYQSGKETCMSNLKPGLIPLEIGQNMSLNF